MAPGTRRATADQNENEQQQSRQQLSPQASGGQVMATKTQKATRNQNGYHRLRDKHQMEGQEQHQNEEQPEFEMTEQTTDQQGTTKRGPTYFPDVWARKSNEGRILVGFNKRVMPRTRRSAVKRKLNHGLQDEDEIEEHGQEQNGQQPNFQVTQQQPIEKQVMAPRTRRATAGQNEHEQQQSRQQFSQQASGEQVMAPRARKATRKKNGCHKLRDKHQMEGHGQHQNEEQPEFEMTEQTTQQGTTKRGPTYLPNVWTRKPNEGRTLVSFNKTVMPRTRRSAAKRKLNHGLRYEDEIEEHGQEQNGQQPNFQVTQQPIEKQVMAPGTQRAAAAQNEHEQQKSSQQFSQQAYGEQVMTRRTRIATRNQNRCHILQDKHQMEGHGQHQIEEQPEKFEMTEQTTDQQGTTKRVPTYLPDVRTRKLNEGRILVSFNKRVMPRTRRSAATRKLNNGLQDEDEIEEHGQEQNGQQPNVQVTEQPIEKQDMAPTSRRATANQNEHEQQQSRQQFSQQASGEQVMASSTWKATRNKNVCHRLREKHQMGHRQYQNEEDPDFEMIEQIIDQQGTTKRGPTYLHDVWARKPNEGRILVSFNKRGQPIGPNKKIFTGFLGTLARNGKFVPLDIEDWRKVPKVSKDEMMKMVKERFEVPQGTEHWILLSIGKKRRHWKSRVKTKCFNPTMPAVNQVSNRPVRVNEDQWKNLLPHWAKEDVKEVSEKNKDHRQLSVLQQTTGKLSFAEVEEELKEQLGRSPSRTEMFDVCYTDSDGNPSNVEVGAALTQMREHRSKLPPGAQDKVGPNDSFAKVRGKDPHGRVRMLGLGLNPLDMWGGIPSRSTCYRMVLENHAALARMEEKMNRAIAYFEQRTQPQQNPNNISVPHPPTSPGQSSNLINLGHQVGGPVLLKSMFDLSKIVAEGYLQCVDPNQEVGGRRLGSNWYEVQISNPIDWDEELIRPYSNLSTIGDAIGACVAWPRHLVIHADDDE